MQICRCSHGVKSQNVYEDGDVKADKILYQTLVENVIYLTHTRTYLAYAVSVESQFMHDSRVRHLQALGKNIQVQIVHG